MISQSSGRCCKTETRVVSKACVFPTTGMMHENLGTENLPWFAAAARWRQHAFACRTVRARNANCDSPDSYSIGGQIPHFWRIAAVHPFSSARRAEQVDANSSTERVERRNCRAVLAVQARQVWPRHAKPRCPPRESIANARLRSDGPDGHQRGDKQAIGDRGFPTFLLRRFVPQRAAEAEQSEQQESKSRSAILGRAPDQYVERHAAPTAAAAMNFCGRDIA